MANTRSVLVVSGFSGLFDSLMPILKKCGFSEFHKAVNIAEAKKTLLTENISAIILNCPLADGFGLDFAIECVTDKKTAVLMFVKSEIYTQCTKKTSPVGILTLKKPNSPVLVEQSVQLLFSASEKMTKLSDNIKNENEKAEELKYILRAKMILITSFSMTEEQAHKYIERRAMESRKSKKEVALNIINSYGI